MQSLSHFSVGIPIQALSELFSSTTMFPNYDLSQQPPWLLLKEAFSALLFAEYCCDLLSWSWQMQPWKRACFHGPSSCPHCCPDAALPSFVSQDSHGWTFTSKAVHRFFCPFCPPDGFLSTFVLSCPISHFLKIAVGIKLLGVLSPLSDIFLAWRIQMLRPLFVTRFSLSIPVP